MAKEDFVLRLLLLVALFFATSASASYMAPFRPLTEQEIMLNSCEISDVVAVVRIDGFYTDFYRDKRSAEETGAMVDIGEFRVLRTLKGKLRAGGKVRVQVPNSARVGNAATGSCGIVFLQRWRGEARFYEAGSEGPLPVWVVHSSPLVFSQGFEPVECADSGLLEHRVRKSLEDVTPEGLARLSDIVLVGEVQFVRNASIKISGIDRGYAILSDYQQVYGPRSPSGLRVMAPIPGYLRPGKQLLYLKEVGPGTFETVGLQAGAQVIKNGKVERSGTRLATILARLEREETTRKARLETHGVSNHP